MFPHVKKGLLNPSATFLLDRTVKTLPWPRQSINFITSPFFGRTTCVLKVLSSLEFHFIDTVHCSSVGAKKSWPRRKRRSDCYRQQARTAVGKATVPSVPGTGNSVWFQILLVTATLQQFGTTSVFSSEKHNTKNFTGWISPLNTIIVLHKYTTIKRHWHVLQ